MDDGCLGYPGASTVTSQALDSIIQCTPMAGNPCNPDMSLHSLPGTCHNELEGERKGDRKALTNRPANSSIL